MLFPPPTQVYSPSKKDISWTGLHEFAGDTITDYSRPSLAIESNSDDLQNKKPPITEIGASSSTILSKPAINFVKSADRPTDKVETAKKPAIKYAELYRKTSKSPNVRAVNRPHMNAAQPKRTSFYKPAHSYVSRAFQGKSVDRTQFRVPRVPTVSKNFPTSNIKFSTADMGKKEKAVKASADKIRRFSEDKKKQSAKEFLLPSYRVAPAAELPLLIED
nr:hypothetical protein [Tanacetum cinerariifolium]